MQPDRWCAGCRRCEGGSTTVRSRPSVADSSGGCHEVQTEREAGKLYEGSGDVQRHERRVAEDRTGHSSLDGVTPTEVETLGRLLVYKHRMRVASQGGHRFP